MRLVLKWIRTHAEHYTVDHSGCQQLNKAEINGPVQYEPVAA